MRDGTSQNEPRPDPLDARALTWASLLARWTEFAQASVALPKGEAGDRWRASVAPVVALQAVVFALSDMGELPPDERALGVDRADALVSRHAAELRALWRDEPMHPALDALIDDATASTRRARDALRS